MKRTILLFIVFFFSFAYAQDKTRYTPEPKYPLLFKAIVPIEKDAPEWIQKMYATEPNLFEIEKAYQSYYTKNKFIKTLHTQNYKHFVKAVRQNQWFTETGIVEKKGPVLDDFPSSERQNNQVASWQPIGPFETFNNGGEQTVSEQVNIYTLAQSKTNPMVLLGGSEIGAVFKSIDKGENWFPVGDTFFNDGEIQSVEIDPTNENIFFVGTPNRIFRSIDGGVTWVQVFSTTNLSVYEFAINPSNNQIIYAAGNKGLYTSVNGGLNWTSVFTDTCWDIKFKTNDANTLFLLKSNPTLKLIEFYKSTNGGTTFQLKSTGWFVPNANSSIGGARMGVTDGDSNRVYVVMLGNVDDYVIDSNFIGVYRSDDAGESWRLPYDSNNDGVPNNEPGGPYSFEHWCFSCINNDSGYDQGFYNLAIDVSDSDPNKFLMGMLNLFKSEDGGKTYTNWGGYQCTECTPYYRHPDQQDILVNGNDVFVATDGGVDLYDNNFNIIKAINKGITGSDNWGFGQGWNEDIVTCGRYHNGNGVYHVNYQDGKFISLGGGEAPTGYVNLGDNFKVYHSDIDGRKVSDDFTVLNSSIPNLPLFPNESYFTNGKSEVEYDPRYFNHLYLGNENKLWKSEDGGNSFSLLGTFGSSPSNIVTGIEVSRQNPSILFVAQRNGTSSRLYRSENGGQTWTTLTLPSTQATMYLTLNENNVLFIAFGLGINKVYKSTNLGQTWTNLTTSTISTQGISGIVAQMGTNDGVYISMSGNNRLYYRNATHTDWQLFNHGLPINTRFMGVLPFYKNTELRISGTRGFWKTPLFEPSLPVAQPMVSHKIVDCNRTAVQFDDYSVLDHTGASWSWSFPGATTVSSTTSRNPLVTYSTPGFYSVSLTITDGTGLTSSKTITDMIEVLPSTCGLETDALNVLELTSDTEIVATNGLTFGTTPNLTFTGWIKPTGIQNDWAGIICFGAGLKKLLGFSSNNTLQFHWDDQYWWLNTGLTAVSNQWNFVAFRVTPTQITIFLNEKKWTYDGNFSSVDLDAFVLGKDYDVDERTFKGQMEEFAIWNKALSDDAIYLGRHLIKSDLTDSNLVAYYQFNNARNLGFVYDKKGTSDLAVSSTIAFPVSTAPVGVGTSDLKTISAAGTYNFSNAQADLNFTSTLPNGKVVVSKLNVVPHNKPETNVVGNDYWILDNYGTATTFTGLTSASLATSANLTGIAPSNLRLYKRGNNNYLLSGWSVNSSATSIATNSMQFSGVGLNRSLQWFVGSDVPLGIDYVAPKATIKVYPNPVAQGKQITVNNLDESFIFRLFDVNGKLLLKKEQLTNVVELEGSVSKGIYFYRIETETKMYNGKLVIE